MPYVYAVTQAPDGSLAAVFGDPPAGSGESALWRHEAVVEAAMEQGPVLPMRFGSVVDDVAAFLAERHDELSAALEHVRGAVELAVRLPSPSDEADPTSGTDYLMRRLASEVLGDRVHSILLARARAGLRRPPRAFAYLVDHEAVEPFRARVAALARELDTTLTCTGPWPPYSFVEAPG